MFLIYSLVYLENMLAYLSELPPLLISPLSIIIIFNSSYFRWGWQVFFSDCNAYKFKEHLFFSLVSVIKLACVLHIVSSHPTPPPLPPLPPRSHPWDLVGNFKWKKGKVELWTDIWAALWYTSTSAGANSQGAINGGSRSHVGFRFFVWEKKNRFLVWHVT